MQHDFEKQLKVIQKNTAEIFPLSELKEKLLLSQKENKPLIVKLGVDPTAPDLHLGHMVVIRKLRDFQQSGHKVVLLIGDFTARIGDPSERIKTRPPLSGEQIDINAKTYADQAFKVLDPKRTVIEYNSKWLSKLNFEEIVKLCSKFTIARILERDDFAKRYQTEKPIFLHEFLYPVMQAYDSVALDADIEIGGTDQKFNLLAGRQLQEAMGLEPQVCITMPILTGTDGKLRMSKTTDNYIGITEEPRHIFGKTMSISDETMESWFKLATELPEEEVSKILSNLETGKLHPADAKRLLAKEVVAFYYDKKTATNAEEEFDRIFKNSGIPDEFPEATIKLTDKEKEDGYIWIVRLLSETGLSLSNREARTLIISGAVKIDGEKIVSDQQEIIYSNGMIIQAGKKRFVKVYFK